jgi:hypothetical protein
MGGKVVHVPQENSHFDQIARSGADRPERDIQIPEHLSGLSTEVILADQFAILVCRRLASDKDEARSFDLDDLRIAWWRAELRWIYSRDSEGRSAGHWRSPISVVGGVSDGGIDHSQPRT